MLKIYDPIYSVSIDGGSWKRLEDPFDTNWFVTDEDLPATENILKSVKGFGFARRTDFART